MKKVFLKKIVEFLPYILVVLVIVLPWFFHSGYLFFTDFVVGPVVRIDWTSTTLIYGLIFRLFGFILPMALVQKLFITAVLLMVLLGGKKIASILLPKKPILVFVASLFFLFNPFIYDRMGYGQVGIVAALGFMAFAVGYLLEYLEKKQSKQILLAGLFTGLSILFSGHFIFFNAVFYVLFLVVVIIRHKGYPWKKLIRDLVLALLIMLILNLNWIFGFFLGASGQVLLLNSGITKQDFIAFQTAGRDAWQALTNILLMGGFWGKDQHHYIDLTTLAGNWGRSFIILLPVVLLGIYSAFHDKKKRSLMIGLLIVFLIAVFLALGVRTGVGEKVTFFLFDYLPFYKGLRETQKWVSLIVVCYGVFLAWGLNALFSTKLVKKHSALFAVILAAVTIMQALPMIWGMSGQFKPINYPNDWREVDQVISTQGGCKQKTLFLPWHMYMSFDFTNRIVANPASAFFQCPVISGTNMEWGGIYDNSQEKEGLLVNDWINAKGDSGLFKNDELNIGYIILAKEIDFQDYLWLNRQKQSKLIQETEHLILYKVINE